MQYGSDSRSIFSFTKDKPSVFDWEEICSNKTEFKDVLDKHSEDEDKVVWICSFCEAKNVLECSEIKFAHNNSRVVHKVGVPGVQKKEPILLIVFDISGSMEEILGNEYNNNTSLMEKIKKTKIYQKIVESEKKEIELLK